MKKLNFLKVIIMILIVLTFSSCKSYVPYNYDVSKYIELGEYKGLSTDFVDIGVSDEDLQQGVNNLLKDNGYGKPETITSGSVILGDKIIIDVIGSVGGVVDNALALNNYELIVGSGTFLDEFEQKIIGQPIGKDFEIDVLFPEDYIKVIYAAKTVHYQIKITSATRMSYPELDEQILKDISEFSSIDALLDDLRARLEEETIKQADIDRENQLWEQVVKNTTVIDYPKDALDFITKNLKSKFEKAAEKENISLKEYLSKNNLTLDEVQEYIDSQAKRTCKDEMVMYAIARQEDIEVTKAEIKTLSLKYVEEYGYKDVNELYKTHSKDLVEQTLLYQKVKDFIVANALEN